jgi:3'(2'), 5'-bisphosphate nucleotidase
MENIIKEVSNIAIEAGKEVLKIYRQDFKVQNKKDKSPVTEADLLSNKIIEKALLKYKWPVLSEESEDNFSRLSASKVWIIDPLDGTKDFIQKTGDFSIMIGLIEDGEPIMGVVYVPIKDKLYYAYKDQGSYLKIGKKAEKKLQVSNISRFPNARLVVSRNHLYPNDVELAKRLDVGKFKKTGSTGIKISLIAENKADLYYNLSGKLGQWDTCAPEIILTEAGGQLTDIDGKYIKYNNKEVKNVKGVVASNRILQDEVIKMQKKIIHR